MWLTGKEDSLDSERYIRQGTLLLVLCGENCQESESPLTSSEQSGVGWDAQLLHQVYQSLGLSALRYCVSGWQPWLADCRIKALEYAYHRWLRAITGMVSTTAVEALRREGH